MSVEAMVWALNREDIGGTDKLVLLGIANHDGDGGAWPTIETLARYASVTPRNARAAVRRLEAKGLLRVEKQAGGTANWRPDRRPNLYVLTRPGREDATDPPTPGREDASNPDGGMPPAEREDASNPQTIQEPSSGTSREDSSLTLSEEANEDRATIIALARHRLGYAVPAVVEEGGQLDDALLLTVYFARQLRARGIQVPEARPMSKGWVEPMEALLRIDGRDPEAVRKVLDWLDHGRDRTSNFWRSNVLSPAKLRLRWDQMAQQYLRDREPSAGHPALADEDTPMSEILNNAREAAQ